MKTRKGFRTPIGSNQLQREVDQLLHLFHKNDWGTLEQSSRVFIKKNPHHLFGHKALIASLTQQHRNEESLAILKTALAKFPNDAELHNNHAAILINLGNCPGAITSAEKAIQIDSSNSSAYANKGLACKKLGAWKPALDSYYKAIELNPNDYISLNNAGIALLELDKPEQAVVCFQAAIQLKSDYHDAIGNLAKAHESLKLYTDAKAEYLQQLEADPTNCNARSRLIAIYRSECSFDEATSHTEILLDQIRHQRPLGNLVAFNTLCLENATLEDQRIAGFQHCMIQMEDAFERDPIVKSVSHNSDNKLLRIGYLSSDFHHHATLMLMIGVLEAHQKNGMDVFLYSSGFDDESALRIRVENACTAFRNIRPLSYAEAAQLIADDCIDILVDLKGHTKDERLKICALRPAPVIVSWLGYPGTVGHPRLSDYIIGDPVVTPLEHQPYYSETLALMPHCYQPNDNRRPIGPKPSRVALGLPENDLVFCSFNQPYKLTSQVFEQWCRLLKAVPESVLWIMADKPAVQDNLISRLVRQGIDRQRLVFADNLPVSEHLGRLQQADLALDTYPYSSHTTGSDALWAGVPFVAIQGDTFASRVSSSLLTNVGLSELITQNPVEACDLAIDLAMDRPRLRKIKEELSANKTTKPLFNTEEFTNHLEQMFHEVWSQHCAGIREPIILSS